MGDVIKLKLDAIDEMCKFLQENKATIEDVVILVDIKDLDCLLLHNDVDARTMSYMKEILDQCIKANIGTYSEELT